VTESVSPASPPAPATRRIPILGIIAFAVAMVALLPSLGVFLYGFLPDMSAAWWLLILTLPFAILVGAIALVLGIIALILDIRARRVLAWSIVSVILSLILVVAPLWLITGGFTAGDYLASY
jgi:hypothetical protein